MNDDATAIESSDDEAPELIVQQEEEELSLAATEDTHPLSVASPPPESGTFVVGSVPVTILSGFLGSGKTTLIKHILESPDHGKRIAVIENEFGEGLEVESLIARDNQADDTSLTDLIELPNGCVCCTVKDNLVITLENLLRKRTDLNYILIECSGMANPGPIASLFWLDDALESSLRLDGIVTLVDAAHIEQQLDTTVEAPQQVAFADRILLNKCDLVTDASSQQRVRDKLQQLNPLAPIQCTTYSAVENLGWILDAHCFDPSTKTSTGATESEPDGLFLPPSKHDHTSAVTTICLEHGGNVSLAQVNSWLATVLWPNQDERDKILRARLEGDVDVKIAADSGSGAAHQTSRRDTSSTPTLFRIKGILSIVHDDDELIDQDDQPFVSGDGVDERRFVCQAVHDLWEIYPVSRPDLFWKPEEDRACKLVLIGRNLDFSALRKGFEMCFP